jgi:hypothetical protein
LKDETEDSLSMAMNSNDGKIPTTSTSASASVLTPLIASENCFTECTVAEINSVANHFCCLADHENNEDKKTLACNPFIEGDEMRKRTKIRKVRQSRVFQGGQDDETAVHQIICSRLNKNYSKDKNYFTMQLGSFPCDLRQINMKEELLAGTTTMPRKLIIIGCNFRRKMEENKSREYICVGSLQVNIMEKPPN